MTRILALTAALLLACGVANASNVRQLSPLDHVDYATVPPVTMPRQVPCRYRPHATIYCVDAYVGQVPVWHNGRIVHRPLMLRQCWEVVR